ncbi:TetR/AcrR family transcriptional regulator [Vallitalea pronyensis]|nr:TetR/AcrR family transcriptional regulator [Vallitalea pronyensis]
MTRAELDKQARRDAIITAAEKVFIEKGYDATSVAEIAKEAVFTKTTVYKYFPTKDHLYMSVALRGNEKLYGYLSSVETAGKNGITLLQDMCMQYYFFYEKHRSLFYIIHHVSFIKQKNPQLFLESSWTDIEARIVDLVQQSITRGITDGSIKQDVQCVETTYSFMFMLTGFFKTLNEHGESFVKHYDLHMKQFVKHAIHLMMDSLRQH